jgi:transcriptional regulator
MIQARGRLILQESSAWKRMHVERLTDFHEAGFVSPWSVDDAPSGFIDGLIQGIVGFEVQITCIEGKWKLSQNRPAADIAETISRLGTQGTDTAEAQVARAIAEATASCET